MLARTRRWSNIQERADDRRANASGRGDPAVFLVIDEQLQCWNPPPSPQHTYGRATWTAVRWGCYRTSLFPFPHSGLSQMQSLQIKLLPAPQTKSTERRSTRLQQKTPLPKSQQQQKGNCYFGGNEARRVCRAKEYFGLYFPCYDRILIFRKSTKLLAESLKTSNEFF